MPQFQKLLYVLEMIQTKLISRNHDIIIIRYFRINKTREMVAKNIIGHSFMLISRPMSRLVISV